MLIRVLNGGRRFVQGWPSLSGTDCKWACPTAGALVVYAESNAAREKRSMSSRLDAETTREKGDAAGKKVGWAGSRHEQWLRIQRAVLVVPESRLKICCRLFNFMPGSRTVEILTYCVWHTVRA